MYDLKMMLEENFLRLAVTARLHKNEYFKNVNFLIFLFSQQVIRTSLEQNKFNFYTHF